MARNPLKGQVAVAGIGATAYSRDHGRTALSLGLEAAIRAMDDAGIDRQQVDGICGTGMTPLAMGGAGFLSLQGALGIEHCTWVKNGWLGSAFVFAVEAVFSGLCDTALVVQAYLREPGMSRAAARDPFRARAQRYADVGGDVGLGDSAKRWIHSGEPYAAIMRRYCHDFATDKTAFGLMAVNNRTYVAHNPDAVLRASLTLDQYHASPMVWEPMAMADMDIPVDCAEAFVITTAERARDLKTKPVFVHAMTLGGTRVGEYYENWAGWTDNAFTASLEGLRARSDFWVDDVDLFYPYDGYTVDAVAITEAAGFCKPGEAPDLLRSSWDERSGVLRLNGRTLINTNGGGLAMGRSGGSNLYSEAVHQLRGSAGDRQIAGAQTALIGIGSFFHDPASVMLTDHA